MDFWWLPPHNGGGAKFSDFEWLPPIMGGSRRESFGGLRESLGRVFEVATPHLREADRDPYAVVCHGLRIIMLCG